MVLTSLTRCLYRVIRPFNTYGPRQSARAVIPTIIGQIIAGKKRIELGAISPTRDFNFVTDICDGFVSISRSPKAIGKVINLGSNFEISIGDTVKLIADIFETEVEIVSDEQRKRPAESEVERLWADNTLALQLTNWSPQFTDYDGLRRGLEKTISWFSDPENQLIYKMDQYNI